MDSTPNADDTNAGDTSAGGAGADRAVILWDLAEHDHRAWQDAGCGTASYAEYQTILVGEMREARGNGNGFVLLHASVTEVLAEIARLDPTLGRGTLPAALRAIYRRRIQADADRSGTEAGVTPRVFLERQVQPLRDLHQRGLRSPFSDSA